MKTTLETIDHVTHRYDTVGDWYYDADGNLVIKASKLSDHRRENLILIHELVEVLTCELDGVTQKQVDEFDKAYEANRPDGDESEPGDDPKAPYHKQHCLATGIERILAAAWGVQWKDYEDEPGTLPPVPEKP